ncbi:GerAB/ArcD/ProY family transporter [Paenibacillus senegalensis]|uniref:GerAB/ArcD/ProY family transporter n=1 Tax=Paenibacillus senegalensis TaxID=1465766 RepID=UPI00028960E1|nr:endospore germination permease [Paenibacillus senegalensis]
MSQPPREITMMQAITVIVSSIIGVGVLALPLFAVQAANSGAPLVTLLGSLLATFGLSLIAMLGMRFPDQSIILYSEVIIGKWLALLGNLAIFFFFAMLTSLTAREFGEVVVTSVLKNTPVEVTVIVMLVLAAISSRNNITTFAYIHFFYFPLLLVPALIIVALSLKTAETIYLQPIYGNAPTNLLQGTLVIAALFQPAFVMSIIIPYMKNPQKAIHSSLWGLLIAGGLYVMIVIAAVSRFGSEEILKLLWPFLELAKATSLPANILERIDAAFLAVWVTAVFTTLLTSYFMTIYSLTAMLKLKDHKMFSIFFLPVIFILAMQPKSIISMYSTITIFGKIGLVLTIGYPGILLLIAILRKKKGGTVDPYH